MRTTKKADALSPLKREKAAEAKTIELEIQTMNLNLAALKQKEARAMRLISGTYDLTGEFTEETNEKHYARLYAWSLRNEGKPLNIFMHAWDDEMVATFGLHDVLFDLASSHRLTVCVQGSATIMPATVMQAAHVRCMSKNSTLSLTPPIVVNGELDPVSSRKRDRFINRLYDELLALLVRRARGLTVKQLKQRIGDSGWSLTASDALKFGLVDKIV